MQLTPRQQLFLVNIRRVAAGRPGYRVATDPSQWFGRELTSADRVKAHRTYGQLERRGLIQRHAWRDGTRRRFKTAALSLTPAGEAVAASLGVAFDDVTDASQVAQTAAAAPSVSELTPATVEAAEPIAAPAVVDNRDATIFAALADATTPTAPMPTAPMPTPIHPTPEPTPATSPAPHITTGDCSLSRQANYERRQAESIAANADPLENPAPIVSDDEALLLVLALESDEPPFTAIVDDTFPVSRAAIDRLAAAGLATVHEAGGVVSVETTAKGAFRAIAYKRDKATSAASTTTASQADASSAAA